MLTDNFVLMNFDRIRYLLISSSLRLGPLLSPRIQNVSAAPNKELLLSILLCRLSEKRTEMSDVQFDDHYYYREAFDWSVIINIIHSYRGRSCSSHRARSVCVCVCLRHWCIPIIQKIRFKCVCAGSLWAQYGLLSLKMIITEIYLMMNAMERGRERDEDRERKRKITLFALDHMCFAFTFTHTFALQIRVIDVFCAFSARKG